MLRCCCCRCICLYVLWPEGETELRGIAKMIMMGLDQDVISNRLITVRRALGGMLFVVVAAVVVVRLITCALVTYKSSLLAD